MRFLGLNTTTKNQQDLSCIPILIEHHKLKTKAQES